MKINIPIRALSVNKAWNKNHKKSLYYKEFERDVCLLLPFNKDPIIEGEIFIKYIFYLKNYDNSDEDNCKKIIQDILVKRGYLVDDKYIKASISMKEKVKNILEEKIGIEITQFNNSIYNKINTII